VCGISDVIGIIVRSFNIDGMEINVHR
jgi:hypothetical protein